ncbi:MAG: ABC transporter permease [Clostridiales bacterium]|nr:ABC transporter permease [Clostridiales bacterium]
MIPFNGYSFLCLISMTLCGCTFNGVCMERLLPVNEATGSAVRRILYWTIFPTLPEIAKVLLMDSQNVSSIILLVNVFYGGICVFLTWRCYRGKLYMRFVIYVTLAVLFTMGDLTFELLYILFTGSAMSFPSYNTATAAVGCMGAAVIGCVYMAVFTLFLSGRRQGKRFYIPLLIIMLTVLICASLGLSGGAWSGLYDPSFIFGSACILFLFYVCVCSAVQLAQKRNTERERAELARAIETERMHYETLNERREELAKLRHDYRNVLLAALYLIEEGDTGRAKEMLEDMTERVDAAGSGPR